MHDSEEHAKAKVVVRRLKEEAKDLGLLRVRKVRELLLRLARRPMSKRLAAELNEVFRRFRPLKKEPFFPPPWPGDGVGSGPIKLGRIQHGLGGQFGLSFEDFFRRVFVTGIIGSGKTFLVYLILSQLVPMLRALNACIVILDPNKDYQGLKKKYPEDVWVIRQEKDMDAPFEPPPGVSLHSWVKTIVSAWGEHLWLQEPSRAKLEDAVMQASRCVRGRAVTLEEAKRRLEATRFRANDPRQRYKQTAEDRLQSVMSSMPPGIAHCRRSFPLDRLIVPGRVIVYPLPHGKEDRALVATQKILKLFRWRQNAAPGEDLNILLVVDEAFLVFPRNLGQGMTGTPLLVEVLNQARRFHLGMLTVTQQSYEVLLNLINSGIVISFMLQDQPSRRAILNAMGVNSYGGEGFPPLKERQAMVYCQKWPRPFLIECSHLDWDCRITDEEIDAEMDEKLEALGGELQEMDIPREEVRTEPSAEGEGAPSGQDFPLSAGAERLLQDIANPDHWQDSLTERFQRLRISSTTKQNKVMEGLEAYKLIETCKVVAGRGARKTIVIPSERARRSSLNRDWAEMPIKGKGGLEHKWYAHQLAQHFAGGSRKAQPEGWLRTKSGGKNVDVLVWDQDGNFTTVEVACRPDHEVHNALAVFENPCVKKHIIVCRDAGVQAKVNARIKQVRELQVLRNNGIIEVSKVSDYLGKRVRKQGDS